LLEPIIVFVGGYLVGSIPFGYLIVKRKAQIDIRRTGSGNAGGFNAFVVTNSKRIGILVGVLDALKGFAAVLGAGMLFQDSFLLAGVALLGAIAGHNYPVWLGFKGGRGLSTAAGGMFLLGFSYTVVWCALWSLARILKRDILVSNLVAILVTPLVLWALPWEWVRRLIAMKSDDWTFIFFSCILSTVLFLSHVDAVKDIWKGSTNEQVDNTLSSHP
jgi:glycerol-3-phosphate acyltransferase PlsY